MIYDEIIVIYKLIDNRKLVVKSKLNPLKKLFSELLYLKKELLIYMYKNELNFDRSTSFEVKIKNRFTKIIIVKLSIIKRSLIINAKLERNFIKLTY